MKRILLMMLLAGLTGYTANAGPKTDCPCKLKAHKTTIHKTAMLKKHTTSNKGTALMVANKGAYIPYTSYAVYKKPVHMTNRFVCTTKKELVADPLSGGMVPVVYTTTSTTCEDKAFITPAPLVTPAVYNSNKTKPNYNSNTQPCAYKSHNIRVSYCVQ